MLKIIADEKIPYIHELFSSIAEIVTLPGHQIQRKDLLDADVLLTRAVLSVNANLLSGTPVTFVGSVTAGYDHLDVIWLEQQGIRWEYAAGANALAVAEYVLCCVADLRKRNLLPIKNCRAAVVGVGFVGSRVAESLSKVGIEVIYNDPPRTQADKKFISTPLSQLTDVDLICLHTPLTTTGEFPTHHLINENFLKKLKPGCVLLNAGRGAVVDSLALLKHDHVIACLDVWENEPHINLSLLKHATLATPHIAGYSKQSKLNATVMIYGQLLTHFQLINIYGCSKLQELPEKITIDIADCQNWEEVLLKIYHPATDDQKMRKTLLTEQKTDLFETLRQEYIFRHEFSAIRLTPTPPKNIQSILRKLGFVW